MPLAHAVLPAYPRFDRFTCRLFLTDALRYVGGACGVSMIDNTHVIVTSGTGANMVPAPEMAAFAERFGFVFRAGEAGRPPALAGRGERLISTGSFCRSSSAVMAGVVNQHRVYVEEPHTTGRLVPPQPGQQMYGFVPAPAFSTWVRHGSLAHR